MGDHLDIESTTNNIEYDDPTDDIPNFRCNARVFFLTYPRCDVPSGDALTLLRGLIGQRLDFICVGHELHQDGGNHLHVVFSVKVCIRTLMNYGTYCIFTLLFTSAKVGRTKPAKVRHHHRHSTMALQHPGRSRP